jgi:LPS-assembly protein
VLRGTGILPRADRGGTPPPLEAVSLMLDFIAPAGIEHRSSPPPHRPHRPEPRSRRRGPRRQWRAFVAAIVRAGLSALLAIALTLPAGAADPAGPGLSPLDPQLPWTVEADHLTYDPARDEYIAEGNVLLAKMDRTIGADRVRYSRRDMMAYAEGHVIVTAGNDRLSGSYLEMDLESERGYLDNGTIFLRESNYHISGHRIERVGPDLYTIDRGVVTTCDGDPPDWKIGGSDIKVHDNGAGSAWNAVVYARDIPLLYSPYVSFPGKDRQTGFLFPEMGYSSRKGFFYSQPFFWAIDDQTDATFYLEYMSYRGWKPGIEYRYYLTRDAQGAVMFDYLHDDQVDNGKGNSNDDWGYNTPGLRPNRDRYWFRMSHVNPLPGGVLGRLDLDIPSDQDYLREFKKGFMGFDETTVYFNRYLGRVMDEYDDPVRINRLQLSKSWSAVSVDAGALYYNDVTKGVNWKDVTHRLPVVGVTAPKQRVDETGFYTNLSSEYDNFWQESGYGVQRADLWPRVYYPFFFPPYATIEPSVGWRETLYNQYKTDANSSWSDDGYFHRELWDTRTVVDTEVYDIYDVDGETVKRIRHSVRPELTHTYVPEAQQDHLPNIDSRDRITNRNRIGYAMTHTLTSKSLRPAPVRPDDSSEEEALARAAALTPEYTYRDFLRLKVGNYYDFARHEEPFGPVLSKLTIDPMDRVLFDVELAYNMYLQAADRFNVILTLGEKRRDHLMLRYRYDRDTREEELNQEYDQGQIIEPQKDTTENQINSFYIHAQKSVTERLSLVGLYQRDFINDTTPSYGLGFIYESQCWRLETLVGLEEEDYSIGLRLTLFGVGDFGL